MLSFSGIFGMFKSSALAGDRLFSGKGVLAQDNSNKGLAVNKVVSCEQVVSNFSSTFYPGKIAIFNLFKLNLCPQSTRPITTTIYKLIHIIVIKEIA